jgi:hypothetical protein
MAATVKIRHPETGGEAIVPQTSLGTWARSGWVLAEDAAPKKTKAAPAGGGQDKGPESKPQEAEL